MKKLFIGLTVLLGGLLFMSSPMTQDVTVMSGTTFTIPPTCRRIALLGCTPHPTTYLTNGGIKPLQSLTLSDFLAVDDLMDSFTQVLTICESKKIDHLLIAYLPIYFVTMKQLLKEHFVPECYQFLANIAPQVADLLRRLKKDLKSTVSVTIVIPSYEELHKIPDTIVSQEERVRYSVKQFPRLAGIEQIEDILIINNKGSSQNMGIINYLHYDYLFAGPIRYHVSETTTTRFHHYLAQDTTHEA